MTQTVAHVVGLLIGLAVGALLLTQLGSVLFFKMPFTRRLMQKQALPHGPRILRAYGMAAAIIGLVFICITTVIVIFLRPALYGYLLGSAAIIVLRAKSWGYSLQNLQEYMESHGGTLEEGPPTASESESNSAHQPKDRP